MTYACATMSSAEIEAFLADKRHAVIGTTRVDGPPQLSPVWYLYRDGKLFVSTDSGSVKCRHLRRDGRVTVCVDGVFPDARYVLIHGTAELVEQRSTWRAGIERAIAERYHDTGEGVARAVGEMAAASAVLLSITSQKIIGRNYN